MSQPITTAPAFQKEKTFSSYSQAQSKHYAQVRRNYSPAVYDTILEQHKSRGGQFDTLLDIGCGPGLATFSLAPHFKQTIGLDPSDGMLSTARSMLPSSNDETAGGQIRFEVSTAEELGSNLNPPIADNSVDLITAANAAHWFDMSGFWPAAARVLKPGGSVALWTSGDVRAHPSTPAYHSIQAALDRHQSVDLAPYYVPGNLLTRQRYSTLPLPWTLPNAVTAFDQTTFYRKEWDPEQGEHFYTGDTEVPMSRFELMLSTSSPVTRWRAANPDLANTDQDVLHKLRLEIEHILQTEAGVKPGEERVKGAVYGVVLVVKKRVDM